jgi:uncharacterized membrane protein
MGMDALTSAAANKGISAHPHAPDLLERILAIAAALLLIALITALAKGYGTWNQVPGNVWVHIILIGVALALTPINLLRKRGDGTHRMLGRIWAAAMFLTAAVSFDIRLINNGQFSPIHVLSLLTVLQVPLIIWSARTHRVALHRRSVRAIVIGALLIAGFFTFPFNRLMGQWLFG